MEFMGHKVYGITDIILGATAVAASLAMHLYPITTFRRIKRHNELEQELYTYVPYFATHLACLLWVGYSIPTSTVSTLPFHKYCLHTINILGFLFQIVYLRIYRNYTKYESEREDMDFLIRTYFGWVLIALMAEQNWGDRITDRNKRKYLGLAAVVSGTIMHMSQFTTIINAVETKYLPFGMCAIYLLDAVAWFAYGYAYAPTYDVYISIASGIGIVLELVQLLLCVIFFMKFRYAGVTQDDVIVNDSETPLLDDTIEVIVNDPETPLLDGDASVKA